MLHLDPIDPSHCLHWGAEAYLILVAEAPKYGCGIGLYSSLGQANVLFLSSANPVGQQQLYGSEWHSQLPCFDTTPVLSEYSLAAMQNTQENED